MVRWVGMVVAFVIALAILFVLIWLGVDAEDASKGVRLVTIFLLALIALIALILWFKERKN